MTQATLMSTPLSPLTSRFFFLYSYRNLLTGSTPLKATIMNPIVVMYGPHCIQKVRGGGFTPIPLDRRATHAHKIASVCV